MSWLIVLAVLALPVWAWDQPADYLPANQPSTTSSPSNLREGGGGTEPEPEMVDYFGFTDDSSVSYDFDCECLFSNPAVAVFTCPGEGNQTLVELSAYIRYTSSFDMRVGIFDTSFNLIAQGAAAVTVSSGSPRWEGHVGQANITPNPVTLVGGTTYVLAVTKSDDTGVSAYNGSYGADAWDWDLGYQNPFSASYSTPTPDTGYKYLVRAGVEAAGGGVSAALTGTATETIDESDIVAGGKTIVLTLTGDTFIPNPS